MLFGILLSFWTWPLWRDLSALQSASHSLKKDGSLSELQLNRRSLIYPIAASFNALAKQIKSLLLTQKELTGAVAHEFRTPLARLKFALAVPPAQDSTEWLAMSQDLDELERLVQEMLDYAAMESTEPELNVAEVPIRSLCQAQVDKLANSHLKKLAVTVTGNEHLLWVDGHLVERAITNILLNASRYAKQQIDIRISEHQGLLTVAIHDDGHGIAQAERAQIFEPFYRPDGDRDRKRGGAGLGLAIVRRVQLWHQGSCAIETSYLGGACFVLTYPIEAQIN
ncbi:histidine kinase [Thalassotalea euphylliae]|uniref:histidine kinase n=1 Tax=Thalassotalea euphylliae TaxID=1655234 RepID=A0A3E0TWJ8_9GAMM|nr:histidine kinase [Thalassotalea euphylliae]